MSNYEIQEQHELLNAKEYAIAENYITYRTQRILSAQKRQIIIYLHDKLLK